MKIIRVLSFLPVLAAALLAQSPKDLKFPDLRPVQLPKVEEVTLSNGIRVFLLADHELPLIRGTALIRTGNLFDPPDKIGLAGVTGEAMRAGGTPSMTGDEIDEALENIAASVESGIGETSGSVSFSCLKQNLDEVLPIYQKVMAEPAFRQERLDLILTQEKSGITRRNDSPGGIAQREFYETVYGKDNPFGWRQEIEHLENIKREDLVAFHKRYFFPANVLMAVYGDFEPAAMKAKLEQVFGSWKVTQPPVPPFPTVKDKPSPVIRIADKSDVNQTFFRVGHLGGVYKNPDYPALDVMADILGGGFGSRLFSKVRTELGYAYSVGANWSANYNHPGTFSISGSTRSEVTADTMSAVIEEVNRIRTAPVTEEELSSAKQKVLNSFVFNFASPSQTLFRLLNDTYHGYPRDFLFQYQKAVEKVTAADVLRVAKQYIRPEQFTVVAVGNRSAFGKPVKVLDLPVEAVDLTIPMPGDEPKGPVSEASIQQGRQALAKIRAAHGGDAILKVKDFTQKGTMAMQGPQGPVDIGQTVTWLAPNHMRQSQATPNGELTVYFDGSSGWIAAPQGSQELPPPFRAQIADSTFRQTLLLLQADQDPGKQIALVEPGVIEISDNQGRSARVHFDSASGQMTGKRYRAMSMQGPPSDTVETFYDFREVDGIRMPFTIKLERDGQPYGELKVESLQINTGVTEEQISRKP